MEKTEFPWLMSNVVGSVVVVVVVIVVVPLADVQCCW